MCARTLETPPTRNARYVWRTSTRCGRLTLKSNGLITTGAMFAQTGGAMVRRAVKHLLIVAALWCVAGFVFELWALAPWREQPR